jgi:DNA repair exonuclease SbcCD nuclease subunit
VKIAIVTDMHIGVRGDSKVFADHQEKFFLECFFPYLDEHGIDTVFDLGDTFDRRKFINYVSLKRGKEFFFDQLAKRNIEYHALVGNHTTYYTNTNEVNSMDLLLKEYDNFHIYQHETKELTFGSTKFIMVPWITKDNNQHCFDSIKNSDAHVLAGHLELKGFEMMKGQVCTHGMDKDLFSHYEQVWSGHFHHPSKYGNIEYLGAPYEMTWSDYQGKRGFHVFDTESRELTRIDNPFQIFHKIEYDDSDMTIEDIAHLDTTNIKDAYIKVIVKNRTNPYIHDLFINKLADAGATDVKSIEDTLNIESEGMDEILDETQDTKDILHAFIDSMETKVDKVSVKRVIDDLYIEAQSIA